MSQIEQSTITSETWEAYRMDKNPQTRNRILMEYLYIVKCIASRMYGTFRNYAEQGDLIGCGTLALIEAIDRYDHTRGIKFETFASIRVRGSMIDYLRKQDWVPRHVRKASKEIEDAYLELQIKNDRFPTDDEVAGHLNISVDELNRLLGSTYSYSLVSFEEMLSGPLPAQQADGGKAPELIFEQKELQDLLARSIEDLSEKERLVISLYYYEGIKAKDIAKVLEVSESRISQIHAKALLKLKASLGQSPN